MFSARSIFYMYGAQAVDLEVTLKQARLGFTRLQPHTTLEKPSTQWRSRGRLKEASFKASELAFSKKSSTTGKVR